MKKINTALAFIAISTMIVSQTFAATGSVTSTGSTHSASSGTVVAPVATPASTATAKADLVLKSAPRTIETKSDSINLEWDKVEEAGGYIVKYGKKSVVKNATGATYEEESDILNSTGTTIKELQPSTTYYFAVVVLDKAGTESEIVSEELSVITSSADSLNSAATTQSGAELDIKEIKVVDNKNLTVEFTKDLADGNVSLKITKTSDNSDVPVLKTEQDTTSKKILKVKVDTVLDASTAYTVSVTSAKDSDGKTNKTAISKSVTTIATLASAADAGSGALTGTGVDLKNAPKTGAEETIIIMAALLLGTIVVFYANRKKAFLKSK
ncbi:MAG: fibronectin type III domain-containing protein [Candidatus Gracilibacteria bacterium]|nr:fibronectin type III domain-containing protein [Candidatus Gracilibacteria bacterium]MDD3120191.1 fibronectin type III domain-containing protein [Candidatus Gracilibacteria bacterium]MDD4530618.1 fibronectin type III domain-containing protein [Candidatus Gracilibacteria bacterium]